MMRSSLFVRFLVIATFLTLSPIFLLYWRINSSTKDEAPLIHRQVAKRILTTSSRETSPSCEILPKNVNETHPQCAEKLAWMMDKWTSHECYREHGVDGSLCSSRIYLSTVEHFCPPVDGQPSEEKVVYAQTRTDFAELESWLTDSSVNYVFVTARIKSLERKWLEGVQSLKRDYPNVLNNRKRLNIIIHLGFLGEKKLNFGVKSAHGGPLGELVQWSDLISSLYILGHTLHISSQKSSLSDTLSIFGSKPPCSDGNGGVDLIITDIMGLRAFKKYKSFVSANACKVRLVDSFGTHAEFNHKRYQLEHKVELGGASKNPWGGHGLKLPQFWSFFPHTHDNSFLGFVVNPLDVEPVFNRNSGNCVLIYGKEKYMWLGAERIIDTLKKIASVHATVSDLTVDDTKDENSMFHDVVNYGYKNASEFHSLLKSVKVFVGIGFPLEGPAPLEAIANGAVFINAKFNPPKSRRNTNFLREKPTLREWTSQCPYLESLGKPYVYTVDVNDTVALSNAIFEAFANPPPPFVPKEFTTEGMLLRINNLVSKQDLCNHNNNYPPKEALQIFQSTGQQSCQETCLERDLICEPTFFHLVNSTQVLHQYSPCFTVSVENSVLAPHDCVLQRNHLLFSCASRPSAGLSVRRICPCRDHLFQQSAICKSCI